MGKMEKGIGFLGKLLNLQKRYGFFSIIKSLVILLMLGYVVFFATNPTYLIEKIGSIQEATHRDAISKRIESDKNICLILEKLKAKTDADRAYLIEFHNGGKNIGSGLPFLYGSMTTETTNDSIAGVEEEYANFNLSLYPLLLKTLSDGYYCGTIESFKEADVKLYYKMKSNSVNELALLVLYNGEDPLGILGLSYWGDKKMSERCGIEIRKAGTQIAGALTY